jgi:hypothetical protein
MELRVLYVASFIQLDCYLRVAFDSSYGFNVDDRQVCLPPICQIASVMRVLGCVLSTIQSM